jgi:predicted MFS family arabinose efflux permease
VQSESLSPADEWKRGWKLVFASAAGFSFFSVMSASVGIFMEPLSKEFGWSRTLLSAGVTIAAVTTAVLSPFFGVLIDRYGARRVAMPGLVATIFATSSFALLNGSAFQWLALWLIYAIISISVKTTVWITAVAGRFSAGRGLALGITLTGTAVAQAALPPLANWLIEEFGWRLAYVWLGFGWGGLTLLLCYLFLFDARDIAVAKSSAGNSGRFVRPKLPGLTVAAAWRNTALWRIILCTLVMMLLTMGLLIHQIPILTEAGVTRTNAAWLASLAGVSGIFGKLISGVLLDRFRANLVGGLTLGATALAFGLLIDGVNMPGLIVTAMVVNGYAAGSKLQIASYLTARYAGMRSYGTIYGFVTSMVALGTGIGPLIAGLTFDLTGSYTPFLLAGVVGSVICGLLIATLPRYPEWTSPADAALAS